MSTIKKKAGRISPVLMGNYDNTTTYRRLDWVYYGGTSYICKKNNTAGIVPSNTERWQKIIELPTELNMIFTEAATRENISSGEKLSVILGKIKKYISDIKNVAFTANYNDLINTPNSLKNPNALNIKFNGTSQASYDGSAAKEVNVTPAGIGAVNTSTLLNTTEQISANTDANNIAGALAAKAMMADYNNKINTINSNLNSFIILEGRWLSESQTLPVIYDDGYQYCYDYDLGEPPTGYKLLAGFINTEWTSSHEWMYDYYFLNYTLTSMSGKICMMINDAPKEDFIFPIACDVKCLFVKI